ncbi:aminotransferase class V-fold PLP-dependent enzyme [Nonomuraea sp. NPDC050153]|uniref:aminotransferase class V-fold PLP-dependent enzyme n=1 Tax=Nonomuraea sp. NPDC050153 TaxID=3364359 RepID=UPI0037B12C2C
MTNPFGVRPVINASATLTALGGSLMPPSVLKAMTEAAAHFVDLPELHDHVGERLAALTRNEAACVTSGAAAAITLTVASCAGEPAQAFPADAEVVMFTGQRNGYDYSARLTGARIVEVGPSTQELRAALARRPACVLWFAGAHYAADALPIEDVIRVAQELASSGPAPAGTPGGLTLAGPSGPAGPPAVPVIVDAAAQIPPRSSLWRFTTELGADAVIFSGGKGLRGPQSSGLVLGKRWIVDRCRAHASPNQQIGRGMKVGKEELLGLYAAVEWTLEQDEEALLASYEQIVDRWIAGLREVPGVVAERGYPSEAGQPHGRAVVRLSTTSGWTRDGLVRALWDGDPRIAVGVSGVPDDAIALNPQTIEPGEDLVVLEALVRHLSSGDGERAGRDA